MEKLYVWCVCVCVSNPSQSHFPTFVAVAEHGARANGFQESLPGDGQLTCEPALCLAAVANGGEAVQERGIHPNVAFPLFAAAAESPSSPVLCGDYSSKWCLGSQIQQIIHSHQGRRKGEEVLVDRKERTTVHRRGSMEVEESLERGGESSKNSAQMCAPLSASFTIKTIKSTLRAPLLHGQQV